MHTPLPPQAKLNTLILCILDGWGIGQGDPIKTGDAIRLASKIGKTPNWDKLTKKSLTSQLQTSGESVGLPKGQMGNSEVGHLHIGAGRVVQQSLTRINEAIESGEFFKNEGLNAFFAPEKSSLTQNFFSEEERSLWDFKDIALDVVNVAGIVSSGGVHGSDKHVLATLKFFHEKGLRVRLHAFLDGRDTKPQAAIEELPRFLEECKKIGLGEDVLVSVMGRYYAMDRDERWERTELAFRAMAFGKGEIIEAGVSVEQALARCYERGEGDEFVKPMIFGYYGEYGNVIQNLFFTNFREDRIRQLVAACTAKEWYFFSRTNETSQDFDERRRYDLPHATGSMTSYGKGEPFKSFHVAFPKESLEDTLGECVAQAGLEQLRIAESEKYPHVTYFFNGGREEKFAGEERRFVPSQKDVATYDQEPEMSAHRILKRMKTIFSLNSLKEKSSLFVVNFANPDMVGHTGKLPETVEAIEETDLRLGELVAMVENSPKKVGLMVFADHGNAEQMLDENGKPHTSHTTNPVPLVITGSPSANLTKDSFKLANGNLTDIAPTALYLLGLDKPEVMTGRSLLTKK